VKPSHYESVRFFAIEPQAQEWMTRALPIYEYNPRNFENGPARFAAKNTPIRK
jgi:hypothetical protein